MNDNNMSKWPTLAGRLNQPLTSCIEAIHQLKKSVPITKIAEKIIMNTNYTDITILLDASGSMAGLKQQTLQGLNQFLQEQKKPTVDPADRNITFDLNEPNTDQLICRVTLIQFTTDGYASWNSNNDGIQKGYKVIFTAKDIKDIPELTDADYIPQGGTPLIRSFCRAIDETGARLAKMDEKDRPGRVIFVTITDGEETEHDVPKADLLAKIKHQTEVYNWQFLYQGSNQSAEDIASEIGISATNAMSYASSGAGTKMSYGALSRAVSGKRLCASLDTMASVGYTVADKLAQDVEITKTKNPKRTTP